MGGENYHPGSEFAKMGFVRHNPSTLLSFQNYNVGQYEGQKNFTSTTLINDIIWRCVYV